MKMTELSRKVWSNRWGDFLWKQNEWLLNLICKKKVRSVQKKRNKAICSNCMMRNTERFEKKKKLKLYKNGTNCPSLGNLSFMKKKIKSKRRLNSRFMSIQWEYRKMSSIIRCTLLLRLEILKGWPKQWILLKYWKKRGPLKKNLEDIKNFLKIIQIKKMMIWIVKAAVEWWSVYP